MLLCRLLKRAALFDLSYEPALQHVHGVLIAVRPWNVSCLLSIDWSSRVTSNLFQENRSAMTFLDESLNEITYQPSKRGHFYYQPSKRKFNTNRKGFQGLSDLIITTTHYTCLEVSKNHWTTKSVCMHVPKYSNFVICSTNSLMN